MRKLAVYTTKNESIAGCIYIFVQLFLLPYALTKINSALPSPFSSGEINFIFFAVNFICVTVISRRYLLSSIKVLINNPFATLKYALCGFFAYRIGQYAVSLIIVLLYPNFINLNDSVVMNSVAQNYTLMSIGVIFLAPVVEEVLYRGVVFGGIHRKNPVLAYIVSSVIFSLIHIVGYIGLYTPPALLYSFILYLPAGFCLAWSYEKSGTIAAPILIHIAVNQLGILYLR